jgi:aspartate/methionine/tyrosine aminotransferase
VTEPLVGRRALRIPSSPTVGIADAVSERKRAGLEIVDFSAGRASEPTPAYIVEAAIEAMRRGDTHQTMARGTPAFREACALKLRRDHVLEADPESEIVATLGCKQGLFLALLATLDPGDEVLVEDPGFVSYEPAVRYCGGTPVPVAISRETSFRFRPADLESRIGPRTKGLVLCSPHNPTGAVHSLEDLEAIASLARSRNLLVYADETYERLTWGGRRHVSIASLPEMKGRSVTLMGLTKSFCMGGWRVGFALAPAPIADEMIKVQQHLVTCASSFGQHAGALAYREEPRPEVQELWKDWEKRTLWMTSALDALARVSCSMPEGAFFAWADVRKIGESSEEVARALLDDHRVAVVPGAAFGPGGEGYVRITCARDWPELELGLERMVKAWS